jgi:hypothetical protein
MVQLEPLPETLALAGPPTVEKMSAEPSVLSAAPPEI